jgi:hypothetical protein
MFRSTFAPLAVLLLTALARADFPEPAKLPSRPEMPDPLVLFNGERVTTREQWVNQRRPELKALFQYYMYGTMLAPMKVEAHVEREDRQAFGGKAILKEITLAFGPTDTPRIHLLLVVPNGRKEPAPVFIGINFCGNHAVVKDPAVRLPTVWMYDNREGVKNHRATDAGRGTQVDVWALEQSVDRGYAVATFYSGDVDPDRPDMREGVQPHLRRPGQQPGPHDWGTIAAWAWGIQRAVDYLVSDKDVDPHRIAVVGHSRLGKTALVAGAFDERIALVIPHQAGCGGTSPSRGKVGESVKQINERFPHWFNGTFKEFNDHPDRLPFDQNGLVALVAPRPVLLTNAVEDQWANPAGQFEVLRAADPAYRFLGAGGLDAKEMPEPGKLIDSTLGYYIRPGKHSMTTDDWKVFLAYADKHLGKPATQTGTRTAEQHLLYVAEPGIRDYVEFGGAGILVFDMDHNYAFVRRIATPASQQKKVENVKGICACAATGKLYMTTLTRLYCLDLATDKTLWEKALPGGCDRMSITPDGKWLYVPSLEGPHWNVVHGATGDVAARLEMKSGAHNTICSLDGTEAYLAGLRSPILRVVNAQTREDLRSVGPFTAPIRPFTVNAAKTLCFVNVNGLLGFEIGDMTTGKKLYRVEVQGFSTGPTKRHGCPSHGIGLTPDEKELWICDAFNSRVHVFDATVMPPKQTVSIALREQPGWITFSLDGRYAYPSTGEVVDVSSKKIVAALRDEEGREVHSEKMVEVVLRDGKVVQTGDQFGLGRKK